MGIRLPTAHVRRGFLALVAASMVLVVPGPTSAASGAGPSLAASDLMAAQGPLVAAADRIKDAGRTAGSGYSNITLSVPEHVVTVYWKGGVPAAVRALIQRLQSPAVIVQVEPARYTRAELDQQAAKLMAGRDGLAASGVLVDEVTPHPDGSGIDVGVTRAPGVPLAASPWSKVAALVATGSTVATSVMPGHHVTTAHRLEDQPAHWAGSRIITVQGGDSCTTGFPMVRTSDGRSFITTAAHCDSDLGHPVNEQWWDFLGPHDLAHRMGEAWYHALGLDVAYIRPPTSVDGYTYDGGVAEAHDFFKPVAGFASNYSGLYICTSGAWSGVHCAIKVDNFAYTWIQEDNSYVPLWNGDQQASCTDDVHKCFAAALGDSGGGVFILAPNRPGAVEAVGSITGGTGSVVYCTNDNGESDFHGTLIACFTGVVYVDEDSILSWLGASIITH